MEIGLDGFYIYALDGKSIAYVICMKCYIKHGCPHHMSMSGNDKSTDFRKQNSILLVGIIVLVVVVMI